MELTQEQIDIITDILEEAFQNAAVYTSFLDDTPIRMDSLVDSFINETICQPQNI